MIKFFRVRRILSQLALFIVILHNSVACMVILSSVCLDVLQPSSFCVGLLHHLFKVDIVGKEGPNHCEAKQGFGLEIKAMFKKTQLTMGFKVLKP